MAAKHSLARTGRQEAVDTEEGAAGRKEVADTEETVVGRQVESGSLVEAACTAAVGVGRVELGGRSFAARCGLACWLAPVACHSLGISVPRTACATRL
jgi:hypothetical protein